MRKSLCSDDNLASITSTLVSQIRCEHLLLSSHELAHSDFNLANGIVVTATVSIDNHELIVLNLFEEVGASEGVLKVWVKRIFNLLSLAYLDPLATG